MQLLRSLGVDHVVDLGNENVTESVKDFLKVRRLNGIDVLYDPVGGKLAKESLRLLKWGANILIIGFASGEIPVIPVNIALVKVMKFRIMLTLSCLITKLLYAQLLIAWSEHALFT